MGLLDLSPYKVVNDVSDVDATVENNQLDAIQAVVNALVDANFDPAAALAVAKLAAGVNGQILQTVSGVPTWVAGTRTTTSALSGGPPASPGDTDIWIATGVDANGARWMFQYNAGSASAFKWETIGGGLVQAEDGTHTYSATGSMASVAGSLSGTPLLTVARAGDYIWRMGIRVLEVSTGGHNYTIQPWKNGVASGLVGGSGIGITGTYANIVVEQKITFAAADTVGIALASSIASGTADQSWYSLQPVRII